MNPIEKLLELKKESGLSREKFARKLGLKKDTIANLEAGRQKSIPDNLALALEKEFRIPFKWWKTGKGDMSLKLPQEDVDRPTAHIDGEPGKLLTPKETEILIKILGENKLLLFLMINKLETDPGKVKKFLLED